MKSKNKLPEIQRKNMALAEQRSRRSKNKKGRMMKRKAAQNSVRDAEPYVFGYESFPQSISKSEIKLPRAKTSFSELNRMHKTADRALTKLRCNATAGDDWALRCLVETLIENIAWLEDMAEKQHTLTRSIAAKCRVWPVLASLHPGRLGRKRHGTRPGFIEQLLTVLRQGSESGIHCHRQSRWGIDPKSGKRSIATAYAIAIVDTITGNRWLWEGFRSHAAFYSGQPHIIPKNIPQWVRDCETLKPFCERTVDEWARVGWAAMLETNYGHPEGIPELTKLSDYRASHHRNGSERVENADRRDAVFKAIKQVLKAIAPPS